MYAHTHIHVYNYFLLLLTKEAITIVLVRVTVFSYCLNIIINSIPFTFNSIWMKNSHRHSSVLFNIVVTSHMWLLST